MLKSASSLKAINYAARIALAQILVERLFAIACLNPAMTFLFVTIILEEHAFPYRQAANFTVKKCKSAVKTLLDGFDYIGFVEPAFYYRAPFVVESSQPHVSWHTHAIVWTTAPGTFVSRKRRFNRTHRAFVPGKRAAHSMALSIGELASYTRYTSKNVLKEYIAYPEMLEVVDLTTGELLKRPSGKWRSRKRDIRPMNLVRALTVVGNRTLKQLSFAGGAGRFIRRDALASARKSLRRKTAARSEQRRRLLFGK